MAKLPSFQFYPGDWLKDPAVSMLSAAARGIWIDMICAMRLNDDGTLTGGTAELSRICRCTALELQDALSELQRTRAADVRSDGKSGFIVTNRRTKRDIQLRRRNALYQRDFRDRKTKVRRMSGRCKIPSSSSSSSSDKHAARASPPPDGGGQTGGTEMPRSEKQRKRDVLFDALRELFYPGPLSRRDGKLLGMAVSELLERGATPDEIRLRAKRYRSAWPDLTMTLTALLKHWHQFATERSEKSKPSMIQMVAAGMARDKGITVEEAIAELKQEALATGKEWKE